MKLHIKGTKIDLTPAIKKYLDDKIGSLSKYLKEWDREGVAEIWVEIGRTTRHHQKGDVYRAEADIKLPGKILRAEHEDWDVRVAIDNIRQKLQRDIRRYKEKARALRRKTK